ncbi:TetR family transcriptional regulator [Halobacillus andaensis]|uniref:TetR family transcriptional regulator n=1 Tax=Halobacillus andaensis TaxID=1176239 RepID=A0A917ET66_HALAA|nr:TetR/AcrR family transcriptional regulator [Halobacillus andaensis]MBP2003371.1 AcrR family transcriptional regulator [Halobacillus andaensis]GGF10134.1 TetR family transcriptional regulator [Halobacillus andaensis]
MLNLRDRIIEQSLDLFDQYGFHGVTVKQIVEASQTSKGGFYHHFQSKDELLFVIHDAFITYVSKEAKRATKTHTSPIDKIQEITRVFVKVFDLYKPHLSVFYQESKYLKPEYEKQIKQKRDEFKDLILQVIIEGQQSGHFRKELPPSLTSMAILGMVNWMYKWYRRDGEYSIDEIADVFIDLILHSLLPSNKSAAYQDQMLHIPFFYERK